MNKKMIRETFWFPAFILLLIILAETAEHLCTLPFDAALVPLALGGGAVCVRTLTEVWQNRRVTTGILVVLALIGTIFTGEFQEGAEVSFMMLLGEALEDFSMKKMRGGRSFPEENNAQRLADRFSNYFLPLIVGICIAVFLTTKDIHRVMSILVIACPCSLVLSSPTAVLACAANASRHQIALPDGGAIERLGAVRTLYVKEPDRSAAESSAAGGAAKENDIQTKLTALGIKVLTRDAADGTASIITDNGLAIGSGADADIVLADGAGTDTLCYLLALTRQTRRVIWENILLFAFLLNLTGITLSGLGLLSIVPGAVLHNISTLCVLLNSARMFRWKPSGKITAS